METDTSISPFLSGLMAPVHDERHDENLTIVGELPESLRGTFVRNGPNPQFTPLATYHPFDGDGMVHAVTIDEGRVAYRNRWVESKGLRAERARGRALFGGVGEFIVPDAEVQAEAGFMKNTANTHTVRHAGRTLALMEACAPTELSPEFDTLGEYDFGGALQGPMTAHPKVDPVTGEMLFFGYSPFPPYLRYHVADARGALVHSVELDLPASVMIHDFAVTENYVIFLDSPALFDVQAMMTGGSMVRWAPENGTRLGVLPRRGDAEDIKWFEIDTCYVVHFFNAWEADGRIELHAPRFAQMPGGFEFDDPSGREAPVPWHWSIDLASGSVTDAQTDDRSGEFPRVNDDLATRHTRFGYTALARSWEFEFDFHGVVKYDLENSTAQEHFYAETEVSGEHVFAADPAGTAEDDGWLLSVVTERTTERSHLAVLDARDLSMGEIARIELPRRVPLGFHANWFPTA